MTVMSIVRGVGVCALGFVVMFVGHFFGLMGYAMAEGNTWHLPYWWSWLVLYPLAAALMVRVSGAHWLATSACFLAFPVFYFGALGVVENDWLSNDGALFGAFVVLAITAVVARFVAGRRVMRAVPAAGA